MKKKRTKRKAMKDDRLLEPKKSVNAERITFRLNNIYTREASKLDAALQEAQLRLLKKYPW
jgi:hypothetical protein